jgi:hypothetical protein
MILKKRLVGSVVAAALAGLVGASLVAGPQLRSPEQVAADAAPPPASQVTAVVEERVLTEPVVLRARVLPGASVEVKPPTSAVGESSVITSVGVRAGAEIREGQVLVVRAGEPMFALKLPFGLYRNLTPGVKGPDVAAVQAALGRLGYRTGTSGLFDKRTRDAVGRFYRDRGHDPVTQAAEQTGDTSPAPSTSPAPPAPVVIFPSSAAVRIGGGSHRVTKVRVKVGSVLSDASKALLELDGGDPYLTALVTSEQAGLLHPGQRAKVTDDVAGRTATAEVSKIGTVVAKDPSSGSSGFPVTLEFRRKALQAADDRTVRVEVGAAESEGKVLAVPVTAVFSKPDGTTYVTVHEDGTDRDVLIEAGQVAGGWVELKNPPAELKPGTVVVVTAGSDHDD